MLIIKVIAGIIGYIIISIIATILFVYLDRKAGETAQKVYKKDSFYEYCMAGFLFPITIPCLAIAEIGEFIKIMCVAIVETKIATEESEDKQVGCIYDEPLQPYICEADWNCKDCPNWRDEKADKEESEGEE